MQQIFPVTLKKAFMASQNVKHFVFECPINPIFNYTPGQFITIHFDHKGKLLRRSYSIANEPLQNNIIEFAASFVPGGPGTELLFNLKPNDKINISGPYGRLILKEQIPTRYIFVATSTGITPFRAMLTELKKRLEANPLLQVVILQGVQKRTDVLYRDEFLAFAKNFPHVNFRMHLSRETAQDLQSSEYLGHVQTAFPELNLNPQNDIVYLCGNPSMIDESFAYLTNHGFTTQQIVREKYISK